MTLKKAPKAPDWLSDEARDEWRRVVPILHARGVLDAGLLGAVECYVSQVATVRQCEAAIKAEGSMVRVNGISKPHPAVGAKNRAAQLVLSLSRRLGLLPESDAPAQAQADDDPYSALGVD